METRFARIPRGLARSVALVAGVAIVLCLTSCDAAKKREKVSPREPAGKTRYVGVHAQDERSAVITMERASVGPEFC